MRTENEAVIAELLRCSDGCLELVDARQFLPLFKTRPGLTSWYVLDDYGVGRKRTGRMETKDAAPREVPTDSENMDGGDADGECCVDGDNVCDVEGRANIDTVDDDVDDSEIACDGVDADKADADGSCCDPSDWSHVEDPALRSCLELGMTLYDTFNNVPSHLDRRVRKSMFPPTEAENSWMHLGTVT